MILLIDNYDSFTYNLYQYLGQLTEVVVYRNDKITIEQINKLDPEKIVISPGPGRPEDAGISVKVIKKFHNKIPLLGVCLGHQCIVSAFSGKIIKAARLFHGKQSMIYHSDRNNPIFEGINSHFPATRYHSLIVERETLPGKLDIIAETKEGEIMAIAHTDLPVYGLQFHPESILTETGMDIIRNFIRV